jgi:hypothetical protein
MIETKEVIMKEMQKKQCFSLRRVYLLLKSDIAILKAVSFTTIITIMAALLLYNLLNPSNIFSVNESPTIFIWMLFIGGILTTSFAFKNLHNPYKNYFFLMLPASNLEKFIEHVFLTAIFYPLILLLVYSCFYWVLSFVVFFVAHKFIFIATPFLYTTWKIIFIYIVMQSIFLVGAVYFKKNVLIKTILALCIIGVVIFVFITLLAKLFFASLYSDMFIVIPHLPNFVADVFGTLYAAFFMLLAPFCWVITYFRMKEIEAK